MTAIKMTDRADVSGTRKTSDGYLIAEAFAARAGVQTYRGGEIGLVDLATVRVWRPESEVTSVDAVRGYSHAPVTLGHPPEMVTADNWDDYAKGEVSTEAEWKDGKIRLPLIVKDAEAVKAIEAGTRELSAGYTCQIEMADGVTPEGETYDAIQREIRINHLAIVPKGRAGSECRIGDAGLWGASPIVEVERKGGNMSDQLKTVVLGDEAIQVSDADAAKIKSFKDAAAKELQAVKDKAKAEIEAKDKELAAKDAKIEALDKAKLSDADLDKLVADRASLVADAKLVDANVETAGLSDADIRKAVVKAKLGDKAVADKSDAYIEARFDGLVESVDADPVAKALAKGGKPATTLGDAYDERNAALQHAWKAEEV